MTRKLEASKTRVVLADDHPVLSLGVKFSLSHSSEFEIVGTVTNSTELVTLLDKQPCDVLLTDYVMPGGLFGDGLSMLEFLLRRYPDTRIVVLTMVDNHQVLFNLVKAGITCIVAKHDDLSEVLQAIHAAVDGRAYLSPVIKVILDQAAMRSGTEHANQPLSKRELEVLRLYLSGLTITEIAGRLKRSIKTVSSQKVSVMRKLGITRELDLVKYGFENGLIADMSGSPQLPAGEKD